MKQAFKYSVHAQWHGQPKKLGGSTCLILREQKYIFEILTLKAQND